MRLFFLLCSILLFAEHTYAAPNRPNILLIVSDDQAWTDYGHMGHPHIQTPRLDALAAESLTFTRGYVAAPLCRPSLASILTGLPCHLHGTTGNDPATGDNTIRNMASRSYPRHHALHDVLYDRLSQKPNFVRALTDAGYATLQTGKWWERNPQQYGFTIGMTHGDADRGARHGDAGLAISRGGIQPIKEFLDATADGPDARPFFIWHAPLLPHTPHKPPAELLEKYERVALSEPIARYWAMCEWFDQTCGELLEELERRGLSKSTAVLYFTDNGWIQDPDQANKYATRSKSSAYEGGVRTPISLRLPGVVSPRRDEKTLVSALDLPTTILRLAGVPLPAGMRGLDLRQVERLRARNQVFGAVFPHDISDVNQPTLGWVSRYVIQGNWKLIDHAKQADELYDLLSDPNEQTNLNGQHPAVAKRLHDEIDAWWGSDG